MSNLVYNAIRCKKCGDIIESRSEHDFKWCKCGSVAIYGGLWYQKITGNMKDIENLAVYSTEPYEKIRKYGIGGFPPDRLESLSEQNLEDCIDWNLHMHDMYPDRGSKSTILLIREKQYRNLDTESL